MRRKYPRPGMSMFEDHWVDIQEGNVDGYCRFYCSGIIEDMTGQDYYVMHSDTKTAKLNQIVSDMDNPYLIPCNNVTRIRFVISDAVKPDVTKLFHPKLPFSLNVAPKKRKTLAKV